MGQMGSAPFASTRRRRRDGGAFSPLALYANGEAGGWYDPSDLTPEKVSWRRNLLTWSEQFDNAAWVKFATTVTANTAIAPDGTTTADKLIETATTAVHYTAVAGFAATANVTYTLSVFAKASERQWIAIGFYNEANRTAWFDLTNGVVGTRQANVVSSSIQPVGNGWYRCTATITAASTSPYPGASVANADNAFSYLGDGTSGVLIWGAQLEAASTASSYQRITDFTSDFLAAFPTHALYQDSAGTTPVTALGQPVGLVLDKSKGGLANLGPELVTNGTFASGTTGWSAINATLTTDAEGVTLTNTATNGSLVQQMTLAAGRTVAYSFTLYSGTINAYLSLDGTSSNSGFTGQLSTPKRYTYYFTTTQANQWVALYNIGASGATMKVGNVSVREVPGAHAIQATSASRPTCDARVNLLTYSEQFDNAAWTKNAGTTVTANAAVAPDGTTTADQIGFATTGEWIFQQHNTTAGNTTFIYTVWLRAASPTTVNVKIQQSGGEISTTLASLTTSWQPFTVSYSTSTSPTFIRALIEPNSNTPTFFAWGADLRLATDAAYPYQRVTTATDYADVQAPRYLTFDGVDDSLYTAASVDFATWTSGTRRNLLTYPSAFDNAAWVDNGGTVTANALVAPDGSTTADYLVRSTGSADGRYQTITAGTSGVVTASIYTKKDTSPQFLIWLYDATASADRFFATVTWSGSTPVITAATGTAATPQDAGNGWWRIAITSTALTGANTNRLYLLPAYTAASNGQQTAFWGAQLELGSTATAFQDVGTDKMTVVTGVRKLSDAAENCVLELSNDVFVNSGSFALFNAISGGTTYRWSSRGTSTRSASGGTAAPVTNVVTGIGDISNDIATIRVSTVETTTTTDQGAGTYGTYVLYIARRNNASLPFNGRIYQLIVRGAQTDTATVQQTERFVAGKTGVTL